MKRLVLLLVIILLIPQYATSYQEVYVSLHALSIVSPGNEFYVDVEVENITDFNAADYVITYNSSIFEIKEIYNGSIGGMSIPVNFSINNTEGICRIVQHMGVSGVSGSGYLSKILFVCNMEGLSSINIEGNLSDTEGNKINAVWTGKDIISTATILKVEAPEEVMGDFNASICIYNVSDFGSINMTLLYNDSFLYPEKIGNGLIGGSEINVSYNIQEGKIKLVGVTGKTNGSGYITKIKFGTKMVGLAHLNISAITISNSSAYPINAFIENSSIFIKSAGPGYPVANFVWEPLYPRDIDEINFNASSSYDVNGVIVNYTWDFGDGNTSYEQNPSHIYRDNGTYNVTLIVTDNDGEKNMAYHLISVSNVEPSAHFTFSPLNPTAGDTIHFTDLSNDPDGYIVNYTWDFGDGNMSYEQSPSHQYADDGTYNVTLENHPPYAPSNPSPYDGEVDVKVNPVLSWQCSDIDGDTLAYDIYFGTYGNMQKISSNQTAKTCSPGLLGHETTYYWRVVAWDSRGAKNESTWHFTTRANSPPSEPVLKGPSSGYAGYMLTFYASSTDTDGDKIRYGFDWDNDGTEDQWTTYYISGAEGSITHSWAGEGTYFIKVRAEDEYGAKSGWSDVKVINIQKYSPPPPPPPQSPPAADFSFEIDGLDVSFHDESTDSDGYIVNYTWDFGDGNMSYEQNPLHKYGEYGNYTVKLIVVDNDGLTDDMDRKISLVPVVKIPDVVVKSIGISPSSPREGDEIEFVIKISNEGDGDAINVTVSYTLDGKMLNSSLLGKISAGGNVTKSFNLSAEKGKHEFTVSVNDGFRTSKKSINFEVYGEEQKYFSVWIVAAIAIMGVAAGAYVAFRKRRE